MKRFGKAGFLKAVALLVLPLGLAGCYYEPGYYTRGDAYYGTEYYSDGYYGDYYGPGYYGYGPGYYGSLGLGLYYDDYYWRHRHNHGRDWNDDRTSRSGRWAAPVDGDRGRGASAPPRGVASYPSRSPGASMPSRGGMSSFPSRSSGGSSAPSRSMGASSGPRSSGASRSGSSRSSGQSVR